MFAGRLWLTLLRFSGVISGMRLLLFLVFLMLHSWSLAEDSVSDSEAYWDYGLGFGAVRFEHYPGSDQFSYLALPAPTFQYRGKILRADDREGAHLYLLKSGTLTLARFRTWSWGLVCTRR